MNAIDTLRQQINGVAPAVDVGTTVRFIKRFRGNATFYTYSAIFTGDAWYTTSKTQKTPGVFAHADFVEMLQGTDIVKVQLATGYETIVDNNASREQAPATPRPRRGGPKPALRRGYARNRVSVDEMPLLDNVLAEADQR